MVEEHLDKPIVGSDELWKRSAVGGSAVMAWLENVKGLFNQIARSCIWAASWVWVPLLAFTITRIGIVAVAYISQGILIEGASTPPYHIRPNNILLDAFGSRWDTGFYLSIADEGYFFQGVDLPSVAFFPLLPLLIRAVAPLIGDNLTAGLLITNVALLVAMMLFYRLVEMQWGKSVAGKAVWYLLLFPTAFFGSAIYTESLFLLTAIGALYFARKGYWESAALLGIAASATRLIGLIVAPMLLLEWSMQRRAAKTDPEQERPSLKALLAPILSPLGTAAYMLYLQLAFGDPLAFARASAAWDRQPQSPLTMIEGLFRTPVGGWASALASGQINPNDWIDFLAVVAFLVIGFILLYQRRWSESVFVLLGVLIPLNSGLLMSQRRYMWVLFPAFILLARWGNKYSWLDKTITVLSIFGLAFFTALFANWYWVA
ncbi:MAG: mannosyltransferase family protein [Candidatus Promineifilaceae bacterium]